MTQPIEPVEVAYVTQANGTYMDSPQVIVNLDANSTASAIKVGDKLYTASALEAAKQEGRREGLEEAENICKVTPPYPFRASIEAAHAIRQRIDKEKP